MATLKVIRTSEYNNKFRDFQIYVNGKKIGSIADGEEKLFEVTSGVHNIRAKIDWCSSPQISININQDDIKTLKVAGYKYGKWIMPASLCLIVLHLILSNFFDFPYLQYLIFASFSLLVYYITIGKNQYLTISEDK
jgi:hypothetical protein